MRYRISPWLTEWNYAGSRYVADNNGWFTPPNSDVEAAMAAAGFQPETVLALSDQNTIVAPNKRVALGRFKESSFTKVLLLGEGVRQSGSVMNVASQLYPAQYAGGTTDSEVYDTVAGYLSILGGTQPSANKSLYVAPAALQWDLQSGQSLLIQMRARVASLPAGSYHILGNCNAGINKGFLIGITPGGAVQPYVKVSDASVQNVGSSGTLVTAGNDFTMTLWIDGASRVANGWMNGIQQGAWTNKAIIAGSTGRYDSFETNIPLMIGGSSAPSSPPARDANAFTLKALRVAVIPQGLTLNNAAMLDFAFRNNPMSILTDTDMEVV